MGSCCRNRRGTSPGCTGAPGARLAGWAQSLASRSCRQHLKAGRGLRSAQQVNSPRYPATCPPLCSELQHEATCWKITRMVPARCGAQRWTRGLGGDLGEGWQGQGVSACGKVLRPNRGPMCVSVSILLPANTCFSRGKGKKAMAEQEPPRLPFQPGSLGRALRCWTAAQGASSPEPSLPGHSPAKSLKDLTGLAFLRDSGTDQWLSRNCAPCPGHVPLLPVCLDPV